MGNGRCNFGCTYNIFLSLRKKNLLVILITVLLYLLNQQFKGQISNESIKWFMSCYFNDIIGGMTFIAYSNIIFSFRKIIIAKLWHIELLMFSCGIFWELITPIYRTDTVSDVWDILAYMIGGLLYSFLIRNEKNI